MEYKTYEAMVVVLFLLLLSFDVFIPTSAHPLLSLDKFFIQICLNVHSLQIDKNFGRCTRHA